jgi:hypothetical protein
MLRVGSCVVLCALSTVAAADNAPIVDRNYAIDLYDGVAIGDTMMVGMGGAGAASINGTAGALINPSAIAVRSTTDLSSWSWGYHLDALTSKFSSDYDNNGVVAADDSGASLVTSGLMVRIGDWSGAVTYLTQGTDVSGSAPALSARASRTRFLVGRYLPQYDLAAGVGLQVASFSLDQGGDQLFSVTGTGLVLGATWTPRDEDFRVGGALDLGISGGKVNTGACDPMDCHGYILPNEVDAPSRLVGGIAYRLGPTPWNQQLAGPFRDERAVTLAADLLLTGSTSNGYGLEAFGMQQLQRSGASIAVSLRAGAELEWLPGVLRVRGGSYWEPSRFDGVAGRVHVTIGAELAVLEFHLFGRRRLQLTFTEDIASRYSNTGIAIGFWH